MTIGRGTQLRALAHDDGCPLVEGKVYTVRRYAEKGGPVFDDCGGPGSPNWDEPGVSLEEVDGAFLLRRFEVVG